MKRKIFLRTIALGLVLLTCVAVAGCAGGLKESDVSYADPVADNILAAIKDGDYAAFSRDFSDVMKKAIPEDSFQNEIVGWFGALGEMKGKTFAGAADKAENGINYTIVIYKVKYEKADVQLTLTFGGSDEKKLVEGLFYK